MKYLAHIKDKKVLAAPHIQSPQSSYYYSHFIDKETLLKGWVTRTVRLFSFWSARIATSGPSISFVNSQWLFCNQLRNWKTRQFGKLMISHGNSGLNVHIMITVITIQLRLWQCYFLYIIVLNLPVIPLNWVLSFDSWENRGSLRSDSQSQRESGLTLEHSPLTSRLHCFPVLEQPRRDRGWTPSLWCSPRGIRG